MITEPKMTANINIRLDDETANQVREIKEQTGVNASQIARAGIKKAISQFKRDGFLKIEAEEDRE